MSASIFSTNFIPNIDTIKLYRLSLKMRAKELTGFHEKRVLFLPDFNTK
jgi:hypothetical protein